jgi:hypothetical protein
MPNNLYASPSLDKETRLNWDKDEWQWQRGTEGKQSTTCHQEDAGHVLCVVEQE